MDEGVPAWDKRQGFRQPTKATSYSQHGRLAGPLNATDEAAQDGTHWLHSIGSASCTSVSMRLRGFRQTGQVYRQSVTVKGH